MDISVTEEGTCEFPLHKHNEEEIVYYVKGEGVMRADGKNYPFSAGTIMVIPRGVIHGSSSVAPFKNECVYCDFPQIKEVTVLSDLQSGFIAAAIKTIYDCFYSRKELSLLLLEPLKKVIAARAEDKETNPTAVEKVYCEIRERFCDPEFSLKNAVLSSHFSDDYFRQIFKKAYGMPPLKLLNSMRMDKARGMLEKGVFGVAEVAYACGFNDPLYFSRAYKNFYGRSPKNAMEKS